MNSAVYPQDFTYLRLLRLLGMAAGALALVGFLWNNSGDQLLAYLVLLSAAVLPSALWIRMGSPAIPVLPVIGLTYIPYFGWPILTSSEVTLDYTAWEILRSALSVALFLAAATAAWYVAANRGRSQPPVATRDDLDTSRVIQFGLAGLFTGLVFHFSVIYGLQGWFGPLFGLVRAVALTLVTIACFLIGITRGQGALRGKVWVVTIGSVALLVILSWSSLFLVGGIIYSMAVIFGYVIAARRVPWLLVAAILVAVTVLHAGKREMRERYWEGGANYGGINSVFEIPGFTAEWVEEGIAAITSTSGESFQTPLERASLIQIVLRVQSQTPDRVDYLGGETYSFLPSALVPRFVDTGKPASQVAMDLLNIRYGLLTAEGAAQTAIGWGLVAEAYANFGYLGVIGIALILGYFCGALQNWARGATTISLPTLVNIAAMMTLMNIEADSIQVCTTLLQSFGAVVIFYSAFRWLASR